MRKTYSSIAVAILLLLGLMGVRTLLASPAQAEITPTTTITRATEPRDWGWGPAMTTREPSHPVSPTNTPQQAANPSHPVALTNTTPNAPQEAPIRATQLVLIHHADIADTILPTLMDAQACAKAAQMVGALALNSVKYKTHAGAFCLDTMSGTITHEVRF